MLISNKIKKSDLTTKKDHTKKIIHTTYTRVSQSGLCGSLGAMRSGFETYTRHSGVADEEQKKRFKVFLIVDF